MDSDGEDTLIGHLEALRQTLLRCLAAVALLFPVGYGVSPAVIDGLVTLCFPEGAAQLNFFSPMEVFLVRLKMGAILAFFGVLPWILWQVWRFLLPALYAAERKALGWWIVSATGLFFAGALFCAFFVLPMLVRFAMSFATSTIQPMLGVANVVTLAGWLLLAFGAMFQTPILVLLSVRFGLISAASLRSKRPYVVIIILVIAAILTPPDVISQIALAFPTWLLFELGLWLAARQERLAQQPAADDDPAASAASANTPFPRS